MVLYDVLLVVAIPLLAYYVKHLDPRLAGRGPVLPMGQTTTDAPVTAAESSQLPQAFAQGPATGSPQLFVPASTLLPGASPGPAEAVVTQDGDTIAIALANNLLHAEWRVSSVPGAVKRGLALEVVMERESTPGGAQSINGPLPVYKIILGNGKKIASTAGRVVGQPTSEPVQPKPGARRPAERLRGLVVSVRLRHEEEGGAPPFDVVWNATLRDGANYVRQSVTVIPSVDQPLSVYKLVLFDGTLPGRVITKSTQILQGDVAFSDRWFLGLEDPEAWNGGGDASHVIGVATVSQQGGPLPPGKARTALFDVTRLVQPGHVHHPYFDNWESKAVVHIQGVQLLADGKVIAKDLRPGTAGKSDTRGNIYTLIVPTAAATAARLVLRFSYHLNTKEHDAKLTFGLNIKGKPEQALCSFLVDAKLQAPLHSSLVIGAVPIAGQQRRAFLYYIEMERARASQINLHYNSWYDLATGDLLDNAEVVDTVHTVGRELVKKRGVVVDSFLMDDGWDDRASVWQFHDSFPHGFAEAQKAAALYGASIGVWMSPWGGYYGRDERVDAAEAEGMATITVNGERFLTLSCAKYRARFRRVAKMMLGVHGANLLKLDGLGTHTSGPRRQEAAYEYEVAKSLLEEFRDAALEDSLFINLSTGTWPSPFWLLHADTVWRRGHDHYFAGAGTPRERWMTYRDGMTHQNVVMVAPLFPLSSVMLHGVIYAKSAWDLNIPGMRDEFTHEVRTAFGAGTMLQEMYITPALLSEKNWDDLAASATWARSNSHILVDSHWIGGDPLKGEVYGWAACANGGAILTLRNPHSAIRAFELEPTHVFDIWDHTAWPPSFTLSSPYADQRVQGVTVHLGRASLVELQPFEVMVLEYHRGL